MPRSLDIWTPAIVHCPLADLDQQALDHAKLTWLPQPRGRLNFRADPFGLWRNGHLHIFVEGFDYRHRRGFIECLTVDDGFAHLRTETVLSEPWHLSYPYVFEAEGDTWMLPEARRSGMLRLYRARRFPDQWEPAAEIAVAAGGVDSTPVWFENRWWLFYAHFQSRPEPSSSLHAASAARLTGPWIAHPLNPLRRGLASTRPAGTPLVRGSTIELPVQDNRATYGGAVRRLTITRLDEEAFEAHDSPWLAPSPVLAPFVDGLHTLAGVGDVTLIDCKRVDRSWTATALRALGGFDHRLRG